MINRIIALFLAAVSALSWAFGSYRPGKSADFKADYPQVERDMEKYRGIYSSVEDCGGAPALFVNGRAIPAAAYMTYIEANNRYEEFAANGYNLYSVPVLFAGRWINAAFDLKPFHGGIFDTKGESDFTAFDACINDVLEACPEAYIFPRLNISMPQWWIDENPDCLDGTGKRELLFCGKYRQTASEMLTKVIDHVNASDYASHIVGYQLAGGNTEEWFHFDLSGGCCENALDEFTAYAAEYYPGLGINSLPDLTLLDGRGTCHKNRALEIYLEFANNAVADTICSLAYTAKKASGGNVTVGAFYGYTLEVTSSLYGSHALKTVLECENIDFLCSPNSYIGTRNPAADWTEMFPADSVRLHGKICMQECDIRTDLTKLLRDSAPGYENAGYDAPVWQPLESRELSINMIRKSFARQLIKGNGFWWFDMWGGWYDSPDILAEMKKYREICASSLDGRSRRSAAGIAVFADSGAYKYMTNGGLRNSAFNEREYLGYMGAPYDFYDVSDFEAVYRNYKAVIFLSDIKTEEMTAAVGICRKEGVKYISLSSLKKSFPVKELRAFCKANGIHIYCETDDIVYINESFAAIHSVTAGHKVIDLGGTCRVRPLTPGGEEFTADKIEADMGKNETVIWEIAKQ